ncbi:hypothetical protein NMG60_11035196 [Bertholletia excelsa]
MQEVAGERGGYLHGRGALDSDDLLYLKEQMEAEEDAERLLRRTEKRAFAAFKKAASLADSSPASVPLALRVESKPKSGIRQQDLLKKVVEVKPKRQRVSGLSNVNQMQRIENPNESASSGKRRREESDADQEKQQFLPSMSKAEDASQAENPVKSLLATYETSDDEE